MIRRTVLVFLTLIASTYLVSGGGSINCNCWQQRDIKWQVVPFNGSGSSGGPGTAPDYRNDDWSSPAITLPFTFCFYNQSVTNIYINNNGSVSIGASYSAFTANTFPDSNFVMIAPFWSDVDTRDSSSGLVYYQLNADNIIIQWDGVGRYNQNASLVNHYQLILTDGVSPLLAKGNNISFCYGDMGWTTGDASNGVGGFGGSPAVAGVNYGDGIHYFQLGQYDHAGTDYDGPFNNNDGVYSLNNQSYQFNICTNFANTPPINITPELCTTTNICLADTFLYTSIFLAPEINQNCSLIVDGPAGITVLDSAFGVTANKTIQYIPQPADVGIQTITITAVDDGTPGGTTSYSIYVNVIDCVLGINSAEEQSRFYYPNPVYDQLTINASANSLVQIRNVLGKLVYEITSGEKLTIDVSNLPAGAYFISLKGEKTSRTGKFFKMSR